MGKDQPPSFSLLCGYRLEINRGSSMSGLALCLVESSDISDNKEDRTLIILDSWESGSPSAGSRKVASLCSTHPLTLDSLIATFEMSWDEVCQTFEGAYFSWDPTTFPHRLSFHGYVPIVSLPFLPTDWRHPFQNLGAR